MGHWGDDFLENDEAVDWLCDLQKYIKNTISLCLQGRITLSAHLFRKKIRC